MSIKKISLYNLAPAETQKPKSHQSLQKGKVMPEITFRPKSKFQKDDCINRNKDYLCPNPSTQEAWCDDGNWHVTIRCCDDPRCMAKAKAIASASISAVIVY